MCSPFQNAKTVGAVMRLPEGDPFPATVMVANQAAQFYYTILGKTMKEKWKQGNAAAVSTLSFVGHISML
jgi:hypothetical protein